MKRPDQKETRLKAEGLVAAVVATNTDPDAESLARSYGLPIERVHQIISRNRR